MHIRVHETGDGRNLLNYSNDIVRIKARFSILVLHPLVQIWKR